MFDTLDLTNFSSDPAFAVDGNLRVTAWNAAAEGFLGFSGAEAFGLPCRKVLQALYPTGETLCSVLCQGAACLKDGEMWGIGRCQVRHKNGEMITAGISSLVLPAEARTDPNQTVAILFLRKSYSDIGLVSNAPMRVFTLGHFGIAYGGRGLETDAWKRKKAVSVLKILVSNLDRPVHREKLIEWIWPDADPVSGWQRLKVTISSLRAELRKGGVNPEIIETVGQSYLLRQRNACVDSDVFCQIVASGWGDLRAGNLELAKTKFEEAEDLYRADLFEDEPYAEWCSVERERLREVHIELLSGMAKCYLETGHYLTASRVCRRALKTDPCREGFVRILMDCLVKMGHPDWARSHFVAWRDELEKEYDLQPTDETLRAFSRLSGVQTTQARQSA